MSASIELEGVRTHNLQNVSLTIRHNALTVICGVSGSGKSSLAFDTLFAEGRRRYVETFSPYARQFLDRVDRPDVDRIDNIPPAIAIRQNARQAGGVSTVGTRSGVLEDLRTLFVAAGNVSCADCDGRVVSRTIDQTAAMLIEVFSGRAMLVFEADGNAESLAQLQQAGFVRAICDEAVVGLDAVSASDSTLLVVADRIRLAADGALRIGESLEQLFSFADGPCFVLVEPADKEAKTLTVDGRSWQKVSVSQQPLCESCGRGHLSMTADSLNELSAIGACPACSGKGFVAGPSSENEVCAACNGDKINAASGRITFAGKTLPETSALAIEQLLEEINAAVESFPAAQAEALQEPVTRLKQRLQFLTDVGVGYLSVNRLISSLSGGEAQRVILSTALGAGLIHTLYVLDEPTAGLHANDTQAIISATRKLQQAGNTVVVVEHDPDFILAADEVIEIGPNAGAEGGQVVFQGSPNELQQGNSVTSNSLNQAASSSTIEKRRQPENWLEFEGVTCHNLRNLTGRIPLGVICAISGVSGAGKSSLLVDSLFPALQQCLEGGCHKLTDRCGQLSGWESLSDVLLLDHSPLPKTRRSIPATVVGCFDEIRKVLALTHEAKKRNFKPGLFSFNSSSGGRCDACEGLGVVKVEMQFLADIETSCETCEGRRFRPDVLEVRYRDRNVHNILQMTADEAFQFFHGQRKIQQRLNALRQAGLSYLRLGQPVSTLSGGESQRLRIAAVLAGVPLADDAALPSSRWKQSEAASSLFILDEPSTGLHMRDIGNLMQCLNHLADVGHSVVVIEHDAQVISACDYQVELGPGPGRAGGKITYSGVPR